MFSNRFSLAVLGILASLLLPWPVPAEEYEVGGPLAGVKLPLYRTKLGEPAGHPGAVPELAAKAKQENPDSTDFSVEAGLHPEVELYPGAVEHWRAYWQHYMPIRSSFDRQSQLKYFVAPQCAGVRAERIEQYAEPVYWVPTHDRAKPTGKRHPPVVVVRCGVKDPVFRLDLGELTEGLYVVRVIGAAETSKFRLFLLPAFAAMRVNDGLQGETTLHRIRIGYVDEFYSIAEFYFHAPQRRQYRAEVWFDEGTQVDLLVHGISLDDVLAGTDRRAAKKRGCSMLTPQEIAEKKEHVSPDLLWARYVERAQREKRQRERLGPLDPKDRWERDAAVWRSLPGPNYQPAYTELGFDVGYGAKFTFGVSGKNLGQYQYDEKTRQRRWVPGEIEQQHGAWEVVPHNRNMDLDTPAGRARLLTLLENKKLALTYTIDDLENHRPLPDPYPYKDTGAGLYTPDPNDPKQGQIFWPIGAALREGQSGGYGGGFGDAHANLAETAAAFWLQAGPKAEVPVRDGAVALLRWAYLYPTADTNRLLEVAATNSFYKNREFGRRRNTEWRYFTYGGFINYHKILFNYDILYDYIKDNDDLARSVARFVPWVKGPQDLIKLLDVYLVQTMAKRVMRYQYYGDGRQPWRLSEIASCVADNDFTRPWMDWLFTRTFFYPQPLGGLPDYAITGTDRDGRSPIGSISYMLGEFSAEAAAGYLEKYIDLGGDPTRDLRSAQVNPKLRSACEFYSALQTAGAGYPRVGDVTGPDKVTAACLHTAYAGAARHWLWTRDPRSAWCIKQLLGRQGQTDAEWAEIEAAAARVRRAPWLDNPSRALPGWAAMLEAGLEHDDYRFRRSVNVRVGFGHGHSHDDPLDLQVHAFGLPMTVDAGQRPGYSDPKDTQTVTHNTVVLDGQNWRGHAWVQALAEGRYAHYVRCQTAPHQGAKLFRRQVALLDVHEGQNSPRQVTPQQMAGQFAGLPAQVVLPASYVFDVFRVAGGARHAYCFHATVNDPGGSQPRVNAAQWQPIDNADNARSRRAAEFLHKFRGQRMAGVAPDTLEVLFQLQKARVTPGKIAAGTEDFFTAREVYDPKSPDKFVKWRVFESAGNVVMRGDVHCHNWEYWLPQMFVDRAGTDQGTVFYALIEPYAGTPHVRSASALAIAGNEADALRAVAVEVKTADGHSDVCFADGRPERTRKVGELEIAGEHAFHSADAQGLRVAMLAGGTRLAGPQVRIEAATAQHTGVVRRVDYGRNKAWIDRAWPSRRRPVLVEVGDFAGGGGGAYVSGYAVASMTPDQVGTLLDFTHSAAYYRSLVTEVNEAQGLVRGSLLLPGARVSLAGIGRGFTASNEEQTKFWRAEAVGSGDRFRLTGAPVRADDFAQGHVLRLWEYGVGDPVRQSTFVSVTRRQGGEYELDANVDFSLALPDAIAVSTDGKKWREPTTARDGKWFVAGFRGEEFAGGPLRVRLQPGQRAQVHLPSNSPGSGLKL
jgi:hypothetical protein